MICWDGNLSQNKQTISHEAQSQPLLLQRLSLVSFSLFLLPGFYYEWYIWAKIFKTWKMVLSNSVVAFGSWKTQDCLGRLHKLWYFLWSVSIILYHLGEEIAIRDDSRHNSASSQYLSKDLCVNFLIPSEETEGVCVLRQQNSGIH